MHQEPFSSRRDAVARLRFSIVSSLLVCPPAVGELRGRLDELAGTIWHHPVHSGPIQFGRSTIERWYYLALGDPADPLRALRRRIRGDRGRSRSIGPALAERIRELHRVHPDFSYALFFDNLLASLRSCPVADPIPSSSTMRRWMQAQGLERRRRRGPKKPTVGSLAATARFAQREVRSYEVQHVHALWHLDFHRGTRRVLLRSGAFAAAYLLAILDDHSRVCCHAQWYQSETAEVLAHGLTQAILKRGLPRATMFDNGAAMRAAEIEEGLHALGVEPRRTLDYSPYQNGKQESFWNNVEGRLLPMISAQVDLTLGELNELTQAWIESDYNRREHSELGMSPSERARASVSVVRPSPAPEHVRAAFRLVATRRQRCSDGTILLEGQRYEVPSRFRHLRDLNVRYARWDLTNVELWDPVARHGLGRIQPLDKAANADGVRRSRGPLASPDVSADVARADDSTDMAGEGHTSTPPSWRVAPYLQQLLDEMRRGGRPPAYLPLEEVDPLSERELRDGSREAGEVEPS